MTRSNTTLKWSANGTATRFDATLLSARRLTRARSVVSPSDPTDVTIPSSAFESARDDRIWKFARPQWASRPSEKADDFPAIRGLQKWQGRIVDVRDGLFTAELTSLDSIDGATTFYADFELALLDDAAVEAGDVVYVTARIVDTGRRGNPSKTVSVRLRRLGKWTEEDITSIQARGHGAWLSILNFVE